MCSTGVQTVGPLESLLRHREKAQPESPPPPDPLMPTLTKAGRYEIVGELGRGAMGVVYKAEDPVIGRTVAVKTIRLSEEGTGLSRPELLQRFQTEARAAGLLTHPNIVVVYDAGEEDGLYYITMELVEGKSLQAHLDDHQSFPLSRVLRIMEQTCSALQFAHERNVVHRDIKPANLMLAADDTVKVTDFGTAKILQFGTIQQTAHVMGTPSYMSPEQVKGKPVDGRSDIFSLGVMLYEMVAGEKPFPGQNITTVIYKIVNEEPVPPRQIDPSIHPGLNSIILKALAKNPEVRYQSCREMLEDLRNYRSVGGNAQSTVILGASAPVAMGGLAQPESTVGLGQMLRTGAGSPSQTPGIRRTGSISPVPEPKKSTFATVFLSLVLLGIIGYGGYRLRPFLQDLLQRRQALRAGATRNPAATPTAAADATSNSSNTNATSPDPTAGLADAGEGSSSPTPSPVDSIEKPAGKKPASSFSPSAAEFKGRIEEAAREKGIGNRLKIQGTGNTLTLAGKLRAREHRELLAFLRQAPADVRVVDDIEYDDAPQNPSNPSDAGDHPVPPAGRGAIHIVTDVLGATATLRAPGGQAGQQCVTPCSINGLLPDRYSLEVRKDGFQPVTTALQVRAGDSLDQKINLDSLAKGLLITSQPPGADVFIDGAKQSGQTPVTLPLAAGQYNLVLRLEGYEPYAEQVQVKNNSLTPLNIELTARANRVSWVDVRTHPDGAEISVDGNPTGKSSPARVQITPGLHDIRINLKGFLPIVRKIAVDEGQTTFLNENLKMK